jgi:hypothetical protein
MRLKDAVYKGKAEGPARKLRFSDGSWSPDKGPKLNAIAI